MKQYFHAFWMCQSMFCAIPCPVNVWDEEARDKMLLFLPIIGLEIGLLWAFLGWLCQIWCIPDLIQGFVLCAFPFLATGYIHLDGFMDVTDAVKSCRNLSKRREILKDSHVGAFAVIGCVLLMLAQFAFCASIEKEIWAITFLPVISRCCSALAIGLLKPMNTSQYSRQKTGKGYLAALCVMLVLGISLAFLLFGKYGLCAAVCMAGCILSIRKGYRALEGMNGDISGYALTVGELWGIACLALI